MDLRNGFYVTTSVLALASLSGCGGSTDTSVTKGSYFDPTYSAESLSSCAADSELCSVRKLALLNAPNNVVYQTRATVAVPAAQNDTERAQTNGETVARDDLGTAEQDQQNE